MESLKATLSTNRILVDGQEVHLTAYNINGNNYVMLRDVGRTVGFNVYWNSDAKCVQVESKKPYTGEAPVTSAEQSPWSSLRRQMLPLQSRTSLTAPMPCVKKMALPRCASTTGSCRRRRSAPRDGRQRRLLSHPSGWRKSNTVTDSRYTGENIHSISELYLNQQQKTLSEAVVELWSNSKAHADNMTSSRYGEIGVGLASGIDKDGLDCWYCVQVFLLDGCEVTWVDTTAMK